MDEELCIGYGRMVYRFDYEKKKPVVLAPLNCMVACVTCFNTCPQQAISFPSVSTVHKLINGHKLIQKAPEELEGNKERFGKKE